MQKFVLGDEEKDLSKSEPASETITEKGYIVEVFWSDEFRKKIIRRTCILPFICNEVRGTLERAYIYVDMCH